MVIWIRATFGAIVMALALAAAGWTRTLTHSAWLAAVVCTVIAIACIRPVRNRSFLALTGGPRPFLLGLAVTAGSAAIVLTLGTLGGWLTWGPLDVPQVLLFLATNTIVAVLLEAFPEELTLRGHTYSTLRGTHRPWLAATVTTALFLAVVPLSSTIQWAVGRPFGLIADRPSLAPAGEDPIAYVVLLTTFGLTLVTARNATNSLWTAIATHLTFLTVNRLTYQGESREAGWSVTLETPDAVLLFPAYLLLAATIYQLIRRTRVRAGARPAHLRAR
ncbi:CAAX prenyl protease-like protein [Kribbella amoyensis]|uniref:CAAX prenyl protease-like protein n=1 Tax=Kribbella amoyensis TaxID=996641 RepID=A0A561BQT6_9ACTN|nr:CPBP family glutamic-type intramembrane protease [Kribbella amoyensis]TWD81247.1 CAAX prenyl protease-like protein [Kribbella amoyensis]